MLTCLFFSCTSIYVSPVPPFEFTSAKNADQFMREIKRCMEVNKTFLPTNTPAALKHYRQLLNASSQFWGTPRRPYGHCHGPFLEDEYIRRYKDRPLSFFSPFIPIFVPWMALSANGLSKYRSMIDPILNLTGTDYLYLIFTEFDYGFLASSHRLFPERNPDNFFILSAGGMGHVAIPWNQCNLTPSPKEASECLMMFCGNPRSSQGRRNLMVLAEALFGDDLQKCRSITWQDTIKKADFGFSPRGVAVSTYRTYELMRIGVIPVIATDRYHWLPYHPALNWSEFSILTDIDEMHRTYARMKSMSRQEIADMRAALIRIVNEFFQWDGFFKHLDMFFTGKGRSYFTCSKAFLTG